jgi:transcriptional regulator of met regulon
VQPLAPTNKIERLAKAFIEGYLEAGGKKETIKKVASPRYTKVFTIFTQPHVILAVSNVCRKVK